MHLFLERIADLHLVVVRPDESTAEEIDVHLTRFVEEDRPLSDVSTVRLQDGIEYIVGRRIVPEARIREAIKATQTSGASLPGWGKWSGDAEVAIAVGASGTEIDSPRTYNFLPMASEAIAPMHAHVQAPFFSRLDRRSVDWAFPINELFLDEIAALAAEMIIEGSRGAEGLPSTVLLDLATWKRDLNRLMDCFAQSDVGLAEQPLLSSRSNHHPSLALEDAVHWDPPTEWFAPGSLSPSEQSMLVSPRLGKDRLARLGMLRHGLGIIGTWDPTADQLADFSEQSASSMFDREVGPSAWAAYYDELADQLGKHVSLTGARIVVGDGSLLSAGEIGRRSSLFFPARPGDGGQPPSAPPPVRRALEFVRGDIPWLDDQNRNRPGRVWLQSSGYVAEYSSEAVLRAVAVIMDPDQLAEEDLQICLDFAVAIWSRASTPLGTRSFAGISFRVPTRGGWRPAPEARFGAGWFGDTSWIDSDLQLLADSLGGVGEFVALHDSLLLSPNARESTAEIDSRRRFLELIGVQHGLSPVLLEGLPDLTLRGSQVRNPSLGEVRDDVARWFAPEASSLPQTVNSATGSQAGRLDATYQLDRVPVLPGQAAWSSLSPLMQQRYGTLVAASIQWWTAGWKSAGFKRIGHMQDSTSWPSPVLTFLRREAWFPQSTPGDRHEVNLVEVAEAWWVTGETPDFLPAPPPPLRRAVEGPAVDALLELGVRHWDGNDCVQRLDHIGSLHAAGSSWVAGTRVEYARSWRTFLGSNITAEPRGVLVERMGAVRLYEDGPRDEIIYFADPDSSASELLPQMPVSRIALTSAEDASRVGKHLVASAPQTFRSISDAVVQVRYPEPSQTGRLLDVLGDWIETVVVLVATHRQSVPMRAGRLRDICQSLRRANLVVVDQFSLILDSESVASGGAQQSAWDKSTGSIVVEGGPEDRHLALGLACCNAIAQVAEVPRLTSQLHLAMTSIGREARSWPPTAENMARALSLHVEDVRLAEAERIGAGFDPSALVYVLAQISPDLAETILDEWPVHSDGIDDWITWTRRALTVDESVLTDVRSWVMSGDLAAPVATGLIDLPTANSRLAALGLEGLSNADAQELQFRRFLIEIGDEVRTALRDAFVDVPDRGLYRDALKDSEPAPDPGWSEAQWMLSEELMRARVDSWTSGFGERKFIRNDSSAGVAECRERGRAMARTTLWQSRERIAAWCDAHDEQAGRVIDVPDLTSWLAEAGFFDFDDWTSASVREWLSVSGYWPDDMPLSGSLADLGLSIEELSDSRARRHLRTLEQKYQDGLVNVGGHAYSSEDDDLRDMAGRLRSSFLLPTGGAGAGVVKLLDQATIEVDRSIRGNSGAGGSSGSGGAARQTPEDKAATIGFAGEVYAGEWIMDAYGQPPETTWVSANRDIELGGSKGSDRLGYDFCVETSDAQRILIEVKATTGNATEFSMGESEVHRAVSLAPNEQYIILFITHVNDDNLRAFYPLPNPLGDGKSRFSVEGRKIRFRFEFTDKESGE